MPETPFSAPSNQDQKPAPPRDVSPFVWLCLAAGISSVLFRILVLGQKEQSALMFIGLPTAMAMIIAFLPRASSATGMIMKGITLFLLLLGILLIEGFICILMAAPLFYAIGFTIGILIDRARQRNGQDKRLRVVVLPVLVLMSLEGASELLSFPRAEAITVSREVAMDPIATRAQLADGPQFMLGELPPFLKLGFPAPHRIEGTGLELGDTWLIHFAGGEGKPGDLRAKVVESSDSKIRVACVSDGSHISHWLDWNEAEWTIEPITQGTRVTLTMRYHRLLDPAWYFKPIEQYGVRKAGEYFLEQTFKSR